VDIKEVKSIEIEYAPKPKTQFLNDGTAFDTYIEYISSNNDICGIGIEVKYTEKSYIIGDRENINVKNKNPIYWTLTKKSTLFKESTINKLAEDNLRQIWRNHLLGLSMIENIRLKGFQSVIVYPSGNSHFVKAVSAFKSLLADSHDETLCGLTFENNVESIHGKNQEIKDWRSYLKDRNIVQSDCNYSAWK